ncbi:MAG: hypothetical protein HDQ95_07860 [Roseburia sp.]|nr:hypothetical protein [Roseburia sp.]
MNRILNTYYADNARKLRETVDRILLKFGGLSDKDRDDFYSLANEVFADAWKRYDRKQSFDGLLYSCLSNRIKSEMTRRNRYKRSVDRLSVSLDMPIGEDDDVSLGDVIAAEIDIERDVLEESEAMSDARIARYLAGLSHVQQRIIQMRLLDAPVDDILRELHLTGREYERNMADMRSFEKTMVLFQKE